MISKMFYNNVFSTRWFLYFRLLSRYVQINYFYRNPARTGNVMNKGPISNFSTFGRNSSECCQVGSKRRHHKQIGYIRNSQQRNGLDLSQILGNYSGKSLKFSLRKKNSRKQALAYLVCKKRQNNVDLLLKLLFNLVQLSSHEDVLTCEIAIIFLSESHKICTAQITKVQQQPPRISKNIKLSEKLNGCAMGNFCNCWTFSRSVSCVEIERNRWRFIYNEKKIRILLIIT